MISVAILTNVLAYQVQAQKPKGPGGIDLYKKGDCERAGVNSNVCIYCEDKELTKNCKEYICTDNGTCTESPFKKAKGALVRIDVGDGKYALVKDSDTTTELPAGVKFKKGKVAIRNGYKAVYSSNKKMIAVMSDNGPGITGTFVCTCGSEEGSCGIFIDGGVLLCKGSECCGLLISIPPSAYLTMEALEKAPEKLSWKKIVFPAKSN